MKKIFISLGLAAAGMSLHAAYAPDMADTSKIWSIQGTLRGFYDDNYATANTGTRGSYGFEVSPRIDINVPLQQTEIGVRYIYGLYYYQERDELGQNPIDQSHQLDLWIDHAFSESWEGRVQNSFVVGQEPQLLNPGSSPTSLPYRANGNNIANYGTVSLRTDWTRLFSTKLTYQNKFYDYENSGATVMSEFGPTPPNPLIPGFETVNSTYAGVLNRIENYISLDFQWAASPVTTFLVGYQYSQVNYTGDEPITVVNSFVPVAASRVYMSDSRDQRSHYAYAGVQTSLLPNLTVAAKVGAQYTEDYNDPTGSTSSFGPYADASLTYTYLPGSYVQLGVTHTRNATDVVQPDASGRITLDQESTLVYGSINHQVTPKLLASLIGNFQNSTFEGGQFNDESDDLYSAGLNLNYAFTQHFSAEVGYNYDNLTSDIAGRSYSRNRVYVGVTASY